MYDRSDKRRLYQLISMYLSDQIDEATFCSDFVASYHIELEHDTLTVEEKQALSELGVVASRFSGFEEDIRNWPGVYYTKDDLRNKIIETKCRFNFDGDLSNMRDNFA